MKITPVEANDILSKGYPPREELKRFPFGSLLCRLWDREDDDGKTYREHGPKVVDAMNILLGSEPNKLMGDRLENPRDDTLAKAKYNIGVIFGHFDFSTDLLFRLAALYHDIGKYIIKERHPTVGWYTMEYLNPDEEKTNEKNDRDKKKPTQKDDLRALLGDNENDLKLLLIMIRDHDEFGVLSTGEASYPILLRAANSLGHDVSDQKKIISAIMWLNLADMSGTPGVNVTVHDVKRFIDDWEWFLDALDMCKTKNERLDDYVIREASRDVFVEERITRLLLEACRGVPNRDKELRQNSSLDGVRSKVKDAISTVYPTQNPRNEFLSNFTHICKLDYAKRFFNYLVWYYEGPPDVGATPVLPKWADEYVKTDDLILAILAILRRLSTTYEAMTHSGTGPGSLIGVELKDLTPSNAKDKTAQIIALLHDSHYPGLSWMMSDCLAWYF